MNPSVLAQRMLNWEQIQGEADELKAEIQAAVLNIGKSVATGNVRASYSGGRKKYDYREAVAQSTCPQVGEAAVEQFTTTVPATTKVDWKALCEHAGIDDVPFTQSEPKVTLKLLG